MIIATAIGQKLLNYCNILRDARLSYIDSLRRNYGTFGNSFTAQ